MNENDAHDKTIISLAYIHSCFCELNFDDNRYNVLLEELNV